MTVRPIRPPGGGPGMAKALANHNAKLCEPCAVQLFANYRKDAA